jgi:4-hydroxy-tetrahydrodipicolinate reductase
MSAALRIALVGARGRMGRFTQALLAAREDLEVVAEVSRGDDLTASLITSRADVGLDFTAAGRGAAHGLAMLAAGVRPLIGTSGVGEDDDRALDAAARAAGLGGLVVPNFCLGVWLQQKLALEAARFLDSFEIVEEHHFTKRDAPSGTAVDTALQLARATGRAVADVPVHSIRLKGLYSNQTVLFGGPGEVLRLEHQTFGLDAFGPGIVAALRYVAVAEGVRRGIGVAFEHAAARR